MGAFKVVSGSKVKNHIFPPPQWPKRFPQARRPARPLSLLSLKPDLGDFEAFLSEIGGPTSGSNLFWGVFGMG